MSDSPLPATCSDFCEQFARVHQTVDHLTRRADQSLQPLSVRRSPGRRLLHWRLRQSIDAHVTGSNIGCRGRIEHGGIEHGRPDVGFGTAGWRRHQSPYFHRYSPTITVGCPALVPAMARGVTFARAWRRVFTGNRSSLRHFGARRRAIDVHLVERLRVNASPRSAGCPPPTSTPSASTAPT